MRSPEVTRETSSIVGGGGGRLEQAVRYAVSTVDLPLDASPTNAQTDRGRNSSSLAADSRDRDALSGGHLQVTVPTVSRGPPRDRDYHRQQEPADRRRELRRRRLQASKAGDPGRLPSFESQPE